MAALDATFLTDPWAEDSARDVERCEREIERLSYMPRTADVLRKLEVERRWLERFRSAA